MELGLLLPAGQAQLEAGGSVCAIVETAVRAERDGFDGVWVGDSLVRARVEPLALLAAIAQATERITIGTALLIPAYRHPAHAAVTLSSLDLLAEGRLVVGVGAGFPGFSEPEFDLVGVRFKTRFSQLDDTVALWRQLWTGAPKSFHGKVLHYDWLPEVPRPARHGGPPIWLGGATPAALERTGRQYDGWLPYLPDAADYARGLAKVGEASGGRSVAPALFATVYLDDDTERGERALDAYCRATYGQPLDVIGRIQLMLTGPDLRNRLRTFAAAGARTILLRIAAVEPEVVSQQLDKVSAFLSDLRRTLDVESL